MSGLRSFEKRSDGVVRLWQIEREGIRCHMAWGMAGGTLRGTSMTLDDEAHAVRHFNKKIDEKRREGYVEVVTPEPEPAPAPAPGHVGSLLDILDSGYEPLDAYDSVYVMPVRLGIGRFWRYAVLTDDGRRGLMFPVKEACHDPELVRAFLDFLVPRRELAFDGSSHHKLPLDALIGPFSHALLCSPQLISNVYEGRVAYAYPIHDCEIGDADTGTWVEARTQGHGSLPNSTWDRAPLPVTDLRYDLRSASGPFEGMGDRETLRRAKFKTGTLEGAGNLLRRLAVSTPKSFVEVRSFRGEVLALGPADLTTDTLDRVGRFVR
ncbi:WGR domain-containing protein [Nonomuraea sp. NPDC049400]|uniref:WGR domain-containing protein n=1 Tax=Nonomuraea sp. NPDC049400 TaxID=3364352 RepID=UPI00379FCBFF